MGILKIFFIIFLILFSWGEVLRFDMGNNLYVKPLDIIAVGLIGIWLAKRFKTNKNFIIKDKLFIPIILFIAMMLMSLLLNFKNYSQNEILTGMSYILRWVLYAGLYFVVKSFSLKFRKKIVYILFFVGIIIVLLGFVQYFLYSNLRNLYYLGWDEHMHRMFSIFLDPNFAGTFFVMYFIFLLGIFLYFLKNNKTKLAKITGLFLTLSLISVFLTYSRSALIMFFVSIIIFSILTKKVFWMIGLILCFLIFALISSRSFNIENINLFRIASSEARLESAKTAIRIIAHNPLTGVGFNTYRYAQIKYERKDPISSRKSHADAGTDNSFLFVLATTGIIGLIFYLNLLWKIFNKSYEIYRNSKDKETSYYMSIIAISSLGGLIVNAFFINSLFYSFIMIWLWIIVGLMENK